MDSDHDRSTTRPSGNWPHPTRSSPATATATAGPRTVEGRRRLEPDRGMPMPRPTATANRLTNADRGRAEGRPAAIDSNAVRWIRRRGRRLTGEHSQRWSRGTATTDPSRRTRQGRASADGANDPDADGLPIRPSRCRSASSRTLPIPLGCSPSSRDRAPPAAVEDHGNAARAAGQPRQARSATRATSRADGSRRPARTAQPAPAAARRAPRPARAGQEPQPPAGCMGVILRWVTPGEEGGGARARAPHHHCPCSQPALPPCSRIAVPVPAGQVGGLRHGSGRARVTRTGRQKLPLRRVAAVPACGSAPHALGVVTGSGTYALPGSSVRAREAVETRFGETRVTRELRRRGRRCTSRATATATSGCRARSRTRPTSSRCRSSAPSAILAVTVCGATDPRSGSGRWSCSTTCTSSPTGSPDGSMCTLHDEPGDAGRGTGSSRTRSPSRCAPRSSSGAREPATRSATAAATATSTGRASTRRRRSAPADGGVTAVSADRGPGDRRCAARRACRTGCSATRPTTPTASRTRPRRSRSSCG